MNFVVNGGFEPLKKIFQHAWEMELGCFYLLLFDLVCPLPLSYPERKISTTKLYVSLFPRVKHYFLRQCSLPLFASSRAPYFFMCFSQRTEISLNKWWKPIKDAFQSLLSFSTTLSFWLNKLFH
ncbi:uncharacterized protein LOC107759945 isoform X1 [Nicotiana tabacum]|uniref:Uncharacterized protein LOC107759945 isoform X1 n=3 Tax=Nicotiana tabacum TaxID=4097 RepID=A0AC58S1D6_TOBAC